MKVISVHELQKDFKKWLEECKDELLIVTENGQPMAAINLITDSEELERLMLLNNEKFKQVLESADQQIQQTGGIEHHEFWDLVGEQHS